MALVQVLIWTYWILRALLLDRLELATEHLAYRQQLASYQREGRRPIIEPIERALWALFSRVWSHWTEALAFVQPATVIAWHRAGWRLFWRTRSQPGPGRPPIDAEIRELIVRMSCENPTWGSPRIVSELALLGKRPAAPLAASC